MGFWLLNPAVLAELSARHSEGTRGKAEERKKEPTCDARANINVSHQATTAMLLQHDVSFLKENHGGKNDEHVLDEQETVARMSANGLLRSC